jgi:hypothetical protein
MKSDRVVMVDCDDTLVMWDLSSYPDVPRVTVNCYGYLTDLVPNEKNIKLLRKFAKLGYEIHVWSGSGWEWADAIVEVLGLGSIVQTTMTKPSYYFDDLPCQEWMGTRIWRDPKTGTEEMP